MFDTLNEVDLFNVCLLATDKEDSWVHKLLKFNASTGVESLITEIPYRRDCTMAFLKGKSQTNVSPNSMRDIRINGGSHIPKLLLLPKILFTWLVATLLNAAQMWEVAWCRGWIYSMGAFGVLNPSTRPCCVLQLPLPATWWPFVAASQAVHQRRTARYILQAQRRKSFLHCV